MPCNCKGPKSSTQPRPSVYGSGSWLLLAGLEPLCFARFGTRQAFHAPGGCSRSSCSGWERSWLTKGVFVWRGPYLSTSINLLLRHRATRINPHFTLQPHTHINTGNVYRGCTYSDSKPQVPAHAHTSFSYIHTYIYVCVLGILVCYLQVSIACVCIYLCGCVSVHT